MFVAGGAALAGCAGATNALTVLSGLGIPTSHVTGNLTQLPVVVVQWDGARLVVVVLMVLAFFVGAAISGAVVESTELRMGRRYGVLLLLAGAAIAAGAAAMQGGALGLGSGLVAMAAGIQNAMATRMSAAVVRTTHMTGVVTDLGIALGKAIAGRGVDGWRVVLYLALLTGFAAGSLTGAVLHLRFGDTGLYAPAAAVVALGVVYGRWRAGHVARGSAGGGSAGGGGSAAEGGSAGGRGGGAAT